MGYGPNKPYVPPLESPETIFGVMERHDLLYESGTGWNWWFFFVSMPFMMWLNAVGNDDADDLYWYNNAIAEGAHAYPHGIHKYYDVFSLRGYTRYIIDYITVYVIKLTSLVTIIPVDIINAWFNTDNSNWSTPFLIFGVRFLISPLLIPISDLWLAYLQIEVERGFYFDFQHNPWLKFL